MAISSRIGPYDIDREIGRGGMGVVYAARDTRLGRSVALKSLPAEFAADPAMRTRFEREARLLAGLSHPNIAGILGLEEADGATYIVLEFVHGQTLSDRLAQGNLAVDEAIGLCAQVASAVEAAHEAGVIHRDLKPGNVMLTDDGKIKVLDFGLAREVAPKRSGASIAQAETLPRSPVTQEGRAIGTPGYMSPEQARGKSLDKRTDIWSFGCVLYETLSGTMAFGGETPSDSIAAILERDPDWSKLPAQTPLRIRELLRRCLEKDVKRRQRDAGDARLELEQSLVNREWSTAAMRAAPGGPRQVPAVLAWIIAALAILVAGFAVTKAVTGSHGQSSAAATSGLPIRTTIVIPPEPRLNDEIWGLRPDGRAIYYIGQADQGPNSGVPQVFMRALDAYEVKPVEGTLGVTGFSFSRDSQWLAFTSYSNPAHERARLSKVAANGGAPVVLAEGVGDYFRMPVMMDDGSVAMRRGQQGREIAQVPPGGGELRNVLTLDLEDSPYPIAGTYPCWGDHSPWLIVTIPTSDSRGFRGSLWAVNVKTGERRRLLDNGSGGACIPGGHILFSRGDSLYAAPFDPQRCEITGSIVPLMNGLRCPPGDDSWAWDVSRDGTLVYGAGGVLSGERQLATVDLTGKVEPLSKMRADFVDSAVPSPDGTMICGGIVETSGLYGLYVYLIADGRIRRLPLPGEDCSSPMWMPAGKQIMFSALNADRVVHVYRRRVDGIGAPESLHEARKDQAVLVPIEANLSGPGVLCRRDKPGEPADIVLLMANMQALPLLATGAHEPTAHVSPDGQSLAYLSDASGRMELYVKRMPVIQIGRPVIPGDEQALMISGAGADNPRWSRDGKTLYFREPPARWMKVAIATEPALAASKPEFLFSLDALRMANDYLESGPGDGQFTFIQRGEAEESLTQINVVQNWFSEIGDKLKLSGGSPATQP